MKQPVKWYTGWLIVIVSALITCLSVGLRFATGPFFKPMLADFHFTREELSLVISLSLLLYGFGMPLAGTLVDRFGTRPVLLMGAAMVTASMIWTAYSETSIQFLLSFGILAAFGLAFTSQVALTPIVSRWFTRRRGLALTILISGAMAGIGIMTPLSTWLIQMMGWRNCLLLLAAVFFAFIVPAAMFVLRDDVPAAWRVYEPPAKSISDKKTAPDTTERWTRALGTASFWQLSFGLFACGFSMNLLGSHGVPMLTDHGFGEMEASTGIGLIGLVAIGSSVLIGIVSDHMPRKNLLAIIYFVRGIGFFALVSVTSTAGLYWLAVVGGLVWAGSTSMSSAILGDLYGIRWVGTLYGLAYIFHQIGAAMGAYLGGWGYETFHTHGVAFGAAGVLLLLASLVSYALPDSNRAMFSASAVRKTPR